MLESRSKKPHPFDHWMDKLFPIGTQLIDHLGIDYSVIGWCAANDQVYLRLAPSWETRAIIQEVAFDKAICWTRLLPEQKMTTYAASDASNNLFVSAPALVVL